MDFPRRKCLRRWGWGDCEMGGYIGLGDRYIERMFLDT